MSRPYPVDVPNSERAESVYDIQQVLTHFSRLRGQNKKQIDACFTDADGFSDFTQSLKELADKLNMDDIEQSVETAVENFVYNDEKMGGKLASGDLTLSEMNEVVTTIKQDIPDSYQYTDPVDEDNIIERAKECAVGFWA